MDLLAIILDNVDRTVPHAIERPSVLFSGNYDWHSSVHAYWAVFYLSRLSRTRVPDYIVDRIWRLLPKEMESVLEGERNMDMPYGISWLLLLLCEVEGYRFVDGMPLRYWMSSLLEALAKHLPSSPGDCEHSELHDSCVFSAFLILLAREVLRSRRRPAHKTLEDHAKRTCVWTDTVQIAKPSIGGFFSQKAVLACVRVLCQRKGPGPRSRPPIAPQPGAHAFGRFVTETWPLALTGESAQVRDMLAVVDDQKQVWAHDFEFSHWIPQFLVVTQFLTDLGTSK